MKTTNQNQLEIAFTPFESWAGKRDLGTCRLSPVTPRTAVDDLIHQHGLDAVAQAFLRVLQPGDEVQVCRKKWTVTAQSKDGKRLTVVVGNEKPLVIQERYVHMNISGKTHTTGQKIMSQPYWIWDSRKVRGYPIVDRLLRDVEGELLTYIHTVQQFRRDNAFVDVLKRCLSQD